MKFYKIIILLLLFTVGLTGCKKEKPPVSKEPEENQEIEEPVEIKESEPEPEPEPEKEGVPSPISGIYAKEEKIDRRIVGVMFDNHPRARWQAGLKDSEIIYEFEVEAPYTRYLGFYLINDPENLGPIRSARPYCVTKALEFDSIYVHVGGSEAAKHDIRNFQMADIDGLSSSKEVFWRKSHKKMPNNLYTSMKVLRNTAKERGYRENGEDIKFLFYENDTDIEGEMAKDIKINYNKNNTTSYIYDEDEKLYYRFKDGKEHIDEEDEKGLSAKNIIVQEVTTRTVDNVGRLSMDLIGSGQARYFTNGIGKDIKWVKDTRKGKTIYYDKNGQELNLNSGVTWIQIIRPTTEVIIN